MTRVSEHPNIVAGYGEQTFAEQYRLNIKLPMPEAKFLTLLKKLGLGYDTCGERGGAIEIPRPRHVTSVDLSKVQKCYEVYGGIDKVDHIGRYYTVYVSTNHQVIYIENDFAFSGP
ncbi:MAG: hypothetical protein ACREHG_03890 [Candidatus Saccharimonadales bacterium]